MILLLQQAGGGGYQSWMFLVGIFLIFYLFMIRPQMRKQKKEREFQQTIGKGSKVITTSGIHGKIVDVNDTDKTVVIETMAGKIKFESSALSMDLSRKVNDVQSTSKKPTSKS